MQSVKIPRISFGKVELPLVGFPKRSTGGVTPVPPSYPPETTIFIDQSISDPFARMSGEFGKDGTPETNVVSWIRANSHRYVGVYNAELGMVLKQLDDNNSELYADGSDASEDIKGVNGGNVFMKMPDFWFYGESLDNDNNKYNIYFSATEPTDGRNWTKWDGNTLIGVYKAVCENTSNNTTGMMFSRSGFTPTVNVSQANFKAKARNRSNSDDHFMIVTYQAHQVMALLYMCYYGNTDSQSQCGRGTSSYQKVTGQTNVDGMNDTVAENSRSINFWGLENWWGDISEWVDNLVTSNSGNVNILDYNGEKVRSANGVATGEYITNMLLEELLDFIATSTSGSATTYYCDGGYVSASDGKVGRRSDQTNTSYGGSFCLYVTEAPSITGFSRGSRLLYHGRTIIANTAVSRLIRKARVLDEWRPIDLQYVYRDGIPTLRTGFDFNICNVYTVEDVGALRLYGLNINYEEIEFENNALTSDYEGNLTFNVTDIPQSVEMRYNGNTIGTLKFYGISESELIEQQRQDQDQDQDTI